MHSHMQYGFVSAVSKYYKFVSAVSKYYKFVSAVSKYYKFASFCKDLFSSLKISDTCLGALLLVKEP